MLTLIKTVELRSSATFMISRLRCTRRFDEWLINRGTERISKAANAICLKDYSSFLKSKEAPA
jgi:hypothetical protein